MLPQGTRLVDSKNFAIGILTTTAAILLVGAIVINTRPQLTLASGMTVTGGDFVITVGAASQTDEELVYIIDTATQKLIAYRFDAGRGQIEIVQGLDLEAVRTEAASAAQRTPPAAP